MIILSENIERFLSSWGAWCVPFEWNGNPYCLPLGWEDELISRGIEFTIEQLPQEITDEL